MAVVMLTACAEDGLNEVSGTKPTDEAPETLIASFEDDDTRIQLNDELRTVWTEGDLVSVFYRSDANQKWQYTGQTGARVGELTRVDAGTATTPTTRVVVVYPYNASYYFNTETYNVQASLPAVQTYLEDSYGVDGNILVSSGEYNQISLKSVCGWLKLQLTGEGEKVRSITLRGNNGEQVAGELYINTSDATATLASAMGGSDDGDVGGAGGGLIFEDTILKEVTLNCGTGVELGAEATAFYIALPPQTFEAGFTVEIEAMDGHIMTKSTNKALTIERNHIQPMTAFEVELKATKPANNEIWYTNGSTTYATKPYKTDFFGANIISNLYDAEKECWIITFDKDIKEIGFSAFQDCTSLTSVTIPDSVTTIGMQAFYKCSSLTSVTIPDSVTTIGYEAFYKCTSLTSVTIPDSVMTIGNYAFSVCDSLKEFKGKFAADGGRCLIIDGVLNAFALGCGITQYTIPNSVTTIGHYAFYKCNSLTSVTIGNGVTTIGGWAFSDCTSLTSVTIHDSVTMIGDEAFHSCDSLKEFKGKFAADGGRCLIIDGVLNAFALGCGATQYTIPDSVTTIGYGAFEDCTSLASVTIPDSVTTIGEDAFNNCDSLTSVTIPDSVTTIGEWAFSDCDSLKTVYCKRTTPPAGGVGMFSGNASDRKIYVPASDDDSIINAYKAKYYWSAYKNYIFEEE